MRIWHIVALVLVVFIVVLFSTAIMLAVTIGVATNIFYHLLLTSTCFGISYIFFQVIRTLYLSGFLKWKDD